jgi:Mg-chelatase subunit ChlD
VQADVYAQNAQGQNIAGPAFASPVTCPPAPIGTTLGNVKATCTVPGAMQLSWDPHTGADHYVVEIFKPRWDQGPRVFGQVATTGTSYTANDPDLENGLFQANIYAQNAQGQNIAGPAFAPQVTCPPNGYVFSGRASLSEPQCNVAGVAGTITLQMSSSNTADDGEYRIRIDKKVNDQVTIGYAYGRDLVNFTTHDSTLTSVMPILTTLGNGDYRYQLEKKTRGIYAFVNGVSFPTGNTAYHRLTCSGNNPTAIPSPTAVTTAAPVCVNNTSDVVLTMDVSGSMDSKTSGVKRIEAAKEAARSFLGLLPNKRQARASVVTYNKNATLVGGLTTDMSSLISKINFKASGGTGIAAGITKANEQFGTANKTNIIILMTDGKANSPRPAGISDPDDPAVAPFARLAAFDAAAKSIETHKTVFYTVGFGKSSSVDTELLSGIARLSNTSPYMASNPNTFVDIFEKLPSEICNDAPVALNRALYNQIRGQLAQ